MPDTPAPEAMQLLLAAAEHVRQGVPEVELEWAWDPDGVGDTRLTVTMRGTDRNTSLNRAARTVDQAADLPGPVWPDVPDTPEGLET